jgi:putative ABC transport system permease protein
MSALRWRKLTRDIWATRTRMAMMTIAIAVSVLAVAALLSSRAIIGREITRNYLDTHPASATLEVPGGIDQATLAAVRAQPDVLDATARTSLLGRIKAGDGPWRMLLLFASSPHDPQRISTVAVQQGSWPPPGNGVLLERTALGFLGVQPGDAVLVQTPGGASTAMTVAGAVHDGGVAPAEQEQTAYGYLTTAGLATLATRQDPPPTALRSNVPRSAPGRRLPPAATRSAASRCHRRRGTPTRARWSRSALCCWPSA